MFYPFHVDIEAAEIKISELDFQNCYCAIQNTSSNVLSKFRVTWIDKHQGVLACNRIYFEELNRTPITIGYLSASKADENCLAPYCGTVKPDTIQFEYDLNSHRICHVIRCGFKKEWRKSGEYRNIYEYIYLKKIGKIFCCIKENMMDLFVNVEPSTSDYTDCFRMVLLNYT